MSHCQRSALPRLGLVVSALATLPALASAADSPDRKQLTDQHFWLVGAVLILMALLFALLFVWQNRGEQAGYFSGVYRDAVLALERSRVMEPMEAKWASNAYVKELLDGATARARAWLGRPENKKPAPAEELIALAREVDRSWELQNMLEQLPWLLVRQAQRTGRLGSTKNPFASEGTVPPGLAEVNRRPGGSRTGGLGGSGPAVEMAGETPLARYDELRVSFGQELTAWAERAASEAASWYQQDRDELERKAQVQADRALNVDFSMLRGRGPEFVLEFTAVVVIIFAAVILGILDVLREQHIGTLLAAIAGYVLGRAGTRGSGKQADSEGLPSTTAAAVVPAGAAKAPLIP